MTKDSTFLSLVKQYCKLLTLAMLLPMVTKAANADEQPSNSNPSLTVGFNKTPIITAFGQIESLTDKKFCYSKEDIDARKAITLEKRKRKLSDLLDKIGEQTSLVFATMDNNIAVKPFEENSTTKPAANNIPLVGTGFDAVSIATVVENIVKGHVSASNGDPLPGVTVKIKGTSKGTATDVLGNFTLDVPAGSTLQLSFVGYLQQEVTVTSNNLVITMQEDTRQMNEVVVTALGIKKETKKLGYAVQKVSGEDMIKANPPSIGAGLMGKVAGLNVSAPNGVEGSSMRLVIRGNTSISRNNQPLIVIDGIPLDNDMNSFKGGSEKSSDNDPTKADAYQDWGSVLNFINQDDVEDMSILKGPTAAALYGARGSNGVIMITMKKGKKRQGLGVDYNFSYRVNNPYRYQDMQNEYGYGGAVGLYSANKGFAIDAASGKPRYGAEATWSGANIDGQYTSQGPTPWGNNTWDLFSWYGTAASWGPKLDGREILWWDGTVRKWDPQPDNLKAFFKNGHTTTHNVSVNGGSDLGTMRLSYTRVGNEAIIPNSNYSQNTVNFAGNMNVSKRLKAEITASYTDYDRLNSPQVGNYNSAWTKFMVYGMSRDYKPLEQGLYQFPNGSQRKFDLGNFPMSYPYGSYGSDIYWNTYQNNTTLQRNQLIGNVKLSAEITPWLDVVGRAGIDYNTNDFESKFRPVDSGGVDGKYGHELYRNTTQNYEFLATAHKNDMLTKGLNLSFTAGASSLNTDNYAMQGWNKGPFATPFIYTLKNVKNIAQLTDKDLTNEYRYEKKLNSLYGLLDLSYKNYLFLTVTGRNDWSSTLPSNSNSYFYPSASLGFVFSDAFKMNTNGWLSFGKVRLAVAGSANDGKPYETIYTYDASVFGGQSTRSIKDVLPPSALKPQRSTAYEAGLQMAFFKNRLSFDFSYYNIKSTDQIIDINVAPSTGVSKVIFNTGKLQNKGFEMIVRGRAVEKRDFSWDVALNLAHNQNKLIDLGGDVPFYEIGNLFGAENGVVMRVAEGQNYGVIYGYDYTYKDGKRVVEDVKDASGNIIGTRYVTGKEVVPIGNATPKLTGGLTNTFNYKGFSLYTLVDFKYGGEIYSGSYAAAMGNGLAPATVKERNGGGLPYTYPDGTTANDGVIIEGVYADGKPNTTVVNNMWKYAAAYAAWSNIRIPRSNSVFENTWVKMREVTLTYQIPASVIRRTGFINNLSVSVIGRDLFYIYSSLPDRLNPEGVNGIGNAQGIEFGAFPGTRSYGASIKASF
ncbi:TonB-linked SusC/RagA family outer membrane protein [Chitinophaga skermanii]|uniref:TonB-linked SusC/RagA family outer membrane protein n=1 Tax=Chitinophaga skermanii TaxID=331697 RepID=A0A327QPU3_9BACT|nr:SusC/RagA family TonB-linked outer membrane protein [Chitinophaga skermanii]RAJ06646.1 TonB-linked SusC/RagA family outer membrane protein [Chitinophaga skermanii]